MKKSTLITILVFLLSDLVFSNGVVFNTNKKESYLQLTESKVNVSIENQVATTVATQTFINNIGNSLSIKYAFPIPEGASATGLRYKINGQWYVAVFSQIGRAS
ncbi:MAG TPA: hypothetical protein ENK91_04260, partial [Bacteroidetes bacterium]|nr:hypothetical protein [Bacteroidota bacterium]